MRAFAVVIFLAILALGEAFGTRVDFNLQSLQVFSTNNSFPCSHIPSAHGLPRCQSHAAFYEKNGAKEGTCAARVHP